MYSRSGRFPGRLPLVDIKKEQNECLLESNKSLKLDEFINPTENEIKYSPPSINVKEELNECGIIRTLKSNENVAPFEIKSSAPFEIKSSAPFEIKSSGSNEKIINYSLGKPMPEENISSEYDLWKVKYLQVLSQDSSQNSTAQNENLLPGPQIEPVRRVPRHEPPRRVPRNVVQKIESDSDDDDDDLKAEPNGLSVIKEHEESLNIPSPNMAVQNDQRPLQGNCTSVQIEMAESAKKKLIRDLKSNSCAKQGQYFLEPEVPLTRDKTKECNAAFANSMPSQPSAVLELNLNTSSTFPANDTMKSLNSSTVGLSNSSIFRVSNLSFEVSQNATAPAAFSSHSRAVVGRHLDDSRQFTGRHLNDSRLDSRIHSEMSDRRSQKYPLDHATNLSFSEGSIYVPHQEVFPQCQVPTHIDVPKTQVINGKLYGLLEQIGKGGFSVVYRAIDPDCKIRAVKCVNLESAEELTISSYQNEINLLQRLQEHDEVIRLYDYMFDKASNKLYVVMEHGDMDLASFFQKMRAKPEILRMLVRPYWIEMLRAVSVLHKKGIVHSDLKPANFVLVQSSLKLIDFGIAKTILPDKTSVTCDQIVGTFNYMSPEAIIDLNGGYDITGEKSVNIKISTKSDIWSLGCILYSLVYARTPFENVRHQLLKLQAIISPKHAIEFPHTDIPHVLDVLKVCLTRDPKSRPSISDLLVHPFVLTG